MEQEREYFRRDKYNLNKEEINNVFKAKNEGDEDDYDNTELDNFEDDEDD